MLTKSSRPGILYAHVRTSKEQPSAAIAVRVSSSLDSCPMPSCGSYTPISASALVLANTSDVKIGKLYRGGELKPSRESPTGIGNMGSAVSRA